MKKTILLMLAVLLFVSCALPQQAVAEEGVCSGIARYFDLYGFTMSKETQEAMHASYLPQNANYTDVNVALQEVLYDGYWIYTSACVTPASPETTLVMPGSAGMGDRVCGGNGEKLRMDDRSFQEAATEDGKRLLSVYVYPKEFDDLPFYLLDHFQDANDRSILVSGSHLTAPDGAITIHWSIHVYEVNLLTGDLVLTGEHELPAMITPLGDVEVKTYTTSAEGNLPFKSITLIHTALTTYALPVWIKQEGQGEYDFLLLDEDHQQFAQGMPLDAFTFAIEQLPDVLFVQVLDSQTQEQHDVSRFLPDAE